MFKRTIQFEVKKNKKNDEDLTIQDTMNAISDAEKAEAIKAMLTFVAVKAVTTFAVITCVRTAAKIAENRLSE